MNQADTTLRVDENVVQRSTGESVTFQRDGQRRITRMTMPDGRFRTYTYDPQGDLRRSTDFSDQTTEYMYDGRHNLLSIVDPRGSAPGLVEYEPNGRVRAVTDSEGNRTEIGHDGVNRQELIVDKVGARTILSYDARGNVIEVIDALNGRTTYEYDANDNLTRTVDPIGNETRYEYVNNNRTAIVDPMGERWEMQYDARGNRTSFTDPEGNVWQWQFDANDQVTRYEDPAGAVTTWARDNAGRATRVVLPDGTDVEYGYNAQGRATSITDQDGTQWTLGRDQEGRMTSDRHTFTNRLGAQEVTYGYTPDTRHGLSGVTYPGGRSVTVERDPIGNPLSTTDPSGRRWEYEWDGLGRLRTQRLPDGGEVRHTYDPEGRILSSDLPGGTRIARVLDRLGRPTRVVTPDGRLYEQAYDAAGNVQSVTVNEQTTNITYDAAGRAVRLDKADGTFTTRTYDRAGRLTSLTDAEGRVVTMEHDGVGRITRQVLPDGTAIAQTYDGMGRPITRTARSGAVWRYDYSDRGSLARIETPTGEAYAFTHDSHGNYETLTDPNGHTTVMVHSATGQLLERSLPLGQRAQWIYAANGYVDRFVDYGGGVTRYGYDDIGRKVRVDRPDGAVEQMAYDGAGRLVSHTDADGETRLLRDASGNLLSFVAKDGTLVSHDYLTSSRPTLVSTRYGDTTLAYDSEIRLASVTDPQGRGAEYTRDAAGLPVLATMPENGSRAWTFADGRLARIEQTDGLGQSALDLQYAYDAGGQISRITEGDGRESVFEYDTFDRLAREAITEGGVPEVITYAYDAHGNITRRADGLGVQNFRYDANDRLLDDDRFAYQWNDNGDLTQRSDGNLTERYTYDGARRLTAVDRIGGQGPRRVEYRYEYDGLLAARTVDGVTTHFVWDRSRMDAPRLLEIRAADDTLLHRYVWGEQLIGRYDAVAGTFSTYAVDHVGTVRAEIGPNGTTGYRYDAYGRLRGAAPADGVGYTGAWTDAVTGFVYLQHRWYSPDMARFTQADQADADIGDPRTYNRYAYVVGDPVHRVDPTGQWSMASCMVTVAIVGVLATMAIGYFKDGDAFGPFKFYFGGFGNGKWIYGRTGSIFNFFNVSLSGFFLTIGFTIDMVWFDTTPDERFQYDTWFYWTLGGGFTIQEAPGASVGVPIVGNFPGTVYNAATPSAVEGWALNFSVSLGFDLGEIELGNPFSAAVGVSIALGISSAHSRAEAAERYGWTCNPNSEHCWGNQIYGIVIQPIIPGLNISVGGDDGF
ncbi:MAG: hypothetical protein KC620_04025, partial [Myxococcales bacterium]|nr:hypothetical protein [Myxococcales bacterium]